MTQTPNYKLIAIKFGELIKWDIPVNEIGRIASAIFDFQVENFPNPSITAVRASCVYCWILTLAKQKMSNEERNALLIKFCRQLIPENVHPALDKILTDGGIRFSSELDEFMSRKFHAAIHQHCRKLYRNGHYFHAVFEACKAYNKMVKDKADETKDGYALMMAVWGPEGVLKITRCESDTDKNVQNGIKFLSAGLMQAIRNPTAHEPADDWLIEKADCLDILSFISFLLNKLDSATYYKG